MPKILCTLPNASEEISGVKFVVHANGMVSEEVSDDVAANFASIPGYEIVGAPAPKGDDQGEADKAAERAALVAKAEAMGVTVKNNWGDARLKSEIEAAEKAKAEAEAEAEKAKADAEAAAKAESDAAAK